MILFPVRAGTRRCVAGALCALLAACSATTPERQGRTDLPPRLGSLSAPASELLARLYRLSGSRTLSGQHNYVGHGSEHSRRAAEVGGAYPAVWGSDFGFSGTDNDKDAVRHRSGMVAEAIRQWRAGSVITLMWHACRPVDDEPCGWKSSVQAELTDAQWTELVTPGTALHSRWLAQVDTVAGYLRALRDAGVPVLWRPYHEMNGDWFWWGARRGDDGYRRLWGLMHQRLTVHHGLENLVWVWNPNAPGSADAYAPYLPDLRTVDVLAADVYGGDFRASHHDQLVALAAGRPIALGEVGVMPAPEVLDRQPRWVWFMTWAGFIDSHNSPERVRALFAAPRVLHREELAR